MVDGRRAEPALRRGGGLRRDVRFASQSGCAHARPANVAAGADRVCGGLGRSADPVGDVANENHPTDSALAGREAATEEAGHSAGCWPGDGCGAALPAVIANGNCPARAEDRAVPRPRSRVGACGPLRDGRVDVRGLCVGSRGVEQGRAGAG